MNNPQVDRPWPLNDPPTCEMDGYWEDRWGSDHYWHCESDAVDRCCGANYCELHLEEHRDLDVTHSAD